MLTRARLISNRFSLPSVSRQDSCSYLFLFDKFRLLFRFVPIITSACMSSLESAKKSAAYAAVECHVKNHDVVGIGSGSTVVYAVEKLVDRVNKEKLEVICIPTSFQAEQLITQNKLVLGNLSQNPQRPNSTGTNVTQTLRPIKGVIGRSHLDNTNHKQFCHNKPDRAQINVVIDGADEVDSNLTLIKGGGGCLLQEKIIASCTDNMIVIADFSKKSTKLGENWKKGVPIEVVPLSYVPVMSKIMKDYGGVAELRMAKMKAGPLVTDNGNFIVDWKFPENLEFNWLDISRSLKMIPGVVETGLFVNMAKKAYFGMADGSVQVQ